MKNLKHFLAILLISLLSISWVKADNGDTITYQLPHLSQHLCVDIENMPTFVIYKPVGFNNVMWYINNVYYYGDSDYIVFEPTTIGDYSIMVKSGGNGVAMGITLYNTLPDPADFQVSSGVAHFNENKDTLWLCGASASVKHGIPGSTFTYSEWNGPNGYNNQTSGSITVTESGWYSFTATNPCGSVTDSFYVAPRPNELPTFEDLLFCNEDPTHTFDAGEGFSYLWKKDGEIVGEEQTLEISEGGSYSVDLNNACVSGTVEVNVEHQIFPLPNPTEYSVNVEIELCHDEIIYLEANPDYTYDSYSWELMHLHTIVSTEPSFWVEYPNEGLYTVTVTKGSCSAEASVATNFFPTPFPGHMCVATFDIESGKNKVVFNDSDPLFTKDYVLCFKQGEEWIVIDSADVQENQSIYELYDNESDPNQQSRTYTVFSRHDCGHMSEISDWHKTIRIGTFLDYSTQDVILNIMDKYQTMSGYQPSSYDIWVDVGEGLEKIGTLDGDNNSFTITNPIEGASYFASVNLPWNCDMSKNTGLVSYSNKRVLNTTNIEKHENSVSNIKIYPNPSNGIFNIEGIQNIEQIEIFDQLGRLILTTNSKTINLNGYESGIYYAKIYPTTNGPVVKRLIVK